jgi:hypothetical protein
MPLRARRSVNEDFESNKFSRDVSSEDLRPFVSTVRTPVLFDRSECIYYGTFRETIPTNLFTDSVPGYEKATG